MKNVFDLIEGLLKLVGGQFIHLSCNDLVGDTELLQPLLHHPIQVRWLSTSIHHHDRKLQVLILSEKFFNHMSPTAPNIFRGLGISITGQIHKDPSILDVEEVDDLGSPRAGTGPGQTLSTHQIID